MVSRTLLVTLFSVALASCGTQSYVPSSGQDGSSPEEPTTSPSTEQPAMTPARPPQTAPDKGASGASAGLLEQAARLRSEGQLERADAVLQRAQRIDPRNPAIYLELAELRFASGDPQAARAMAERGLLYCNGAECRQLRALAER